MRISNVVTQDIDQVDSIDELFNKQHQLEKQIRQVIDTKTQDVPLIPPLEYLKQLGKDLKILD